MRFLTILLAILPLVAQTELRLRTGGYDSTYRVTAISAATPAVVTVQDYLLRSQHNMDDGQAVHFQFVPGCRNIEGYRKVGTGNKSAGTFSVLNPDGSNFTCEASFDSQWGAGWVGPVTTVTRRTTPMLLPPSGDIYTRMTDPDGAGASRAPVWEEANNPAWDAISTRFADGGGYVDGASCDGSTPALCPIAAATILNGIDGPDMLAMGIMWYSDNSKTQQLNTLRYILNHFHETLIVGLAPSGFRYFANFPCDVNAQGCGLSSGSDWVSFDLAWLASAFDLVKSALSSEEKTAFANKILSGWDGSSCTDSLPIVATGSTVAGTKNVTGTGLSAFSSGDTIFFHANTGSTGTGYFLTVDQVANDSALTTTANVPTTWTNTAIHKLTPTYSEGMCGPLYLANSHLGADPAVIHVGTSRLAAAMNNSQTTLTVETPTTFFAVEPYYILIDSEIMLVTDRTGSTMTATRAQLGTTAAAHSQYKNVTARKQAQSFLAGGWTQSAVNQFAWTQGGVHNLFSQKQLGGITVGLALADVDSRAVDLAERTWNHFYNLTYPYRADYWAGNMNGGITQGYGYGRWSAQNVIPGLAALYGVNPGIDTFQSYYWQHLKMPYYHTFPGSWDDGPLSLNVSDPWEGNKWYSLPVAQYIWSGNSETAYANYWWRSLANYHSATIYNSALHKRVRFFAAAYMRETDTSTDPRSIINPWASLTSTAFDAVPGSAHGIWTSKSDFTATASWVWAPLGMHYSADHNIDVFSQPVPYWVSKGSELFLGPTTNIGTGMNTFQVGATSLLRSSSRSFPTYTPLATDGGQRNTIDLTGGTANYTHARGDLKESWASTSGITKAYRTLVHLKNGAEYVIVYDDFASGSQPYVVRESYYRTDEPTVALVRDGYSTTFTKSGGRLSSIYLWPDGDTPAATEAAGTSSIVLSFAMGTKTSGRRLAVHRLSSSTSDAMPTTQLLATTDANTVAVEMVDSTNSRVIAFAKDSAARETVTYTSTINGTGRHLILNLAPGVYAVTLAGNAVSGSPFTVTAGDGSLEFSAGSGAVVATSQALPLVVNTTSLASGQVGASYSATISVSGGTLPYSWDVSAGALPTGLTLSAGGAVTGTPTVAGSFDFTARVTDGDSSEATQPLSINIATAEVPPVALAVDSLQPASTSVLVTFSAAGLAYTTSCVVEARDVDTQATVASTTSVNDAAKRQAVIVGLTPATQYELKINCGGDATLEDITFATTAATSGDSKGVTVTLKPPSSLAEVIGKLKVEYGSAFGDSVTDAVADAGGRYSVTIPAQTVGSIVQYRWQWLTPADVAVTGVSKTRFAVVK